MMFPPGLQIYLRPRMMLTFDLLSRKVDHLCQKSVHFQNIVIATL